MKLSLKIIIILIIAVFLAFATFMNKKESPSNKKPMVAVTTFALHDILKHISGDTLKIVNVLPFGVDPHSFEPTPKLIGDIEKSALFIYSGAGLEPWTHGFDFASRVINMSKYVELRELHEEKHEEEEHPNHHNHSGKDPHYWLNFSNMIQATNVITNELIKLFPAHKKLYSDNKDKYITMLKKLDLEYKNQLLSCKKHTIIVNHNAFGYLADKYHFHVESLSGLSPEAMPNAKNIIRIIEIIKEHQVSTLFFETFASNRVVNSIAQEANVKVDVLQPLGNITADEAAQQLTYQKMMTTNLFKLSRALECH